MIRTIGWLLVGGVCGAALVFLAVDQRTASAGLAVYGDAASIDDVETLEVRLAGVLAEPASAARDLELDALLARLAMLDAAAAAQLAESLPLDERLIAAAYRYWGEADAEAALRALSSLAQPAARRAAALGLLEAVGNDLAGAEWIAAALPPVELPSFQADWLARRAAHDPDGAMRALLSLSNRSTQRLAATRIGAAWAMHDPERALYEAWQLPEHLQADYRRSVTGTWARVDSEGVLAHIERTEPDVLDVIDALTFIVAGDPEGVLAIADRMSSPQAMSLQVVAFTALAERDAEATLRRVESMPAGTERDQIVTMVAGITAMSDPDMATDWVERMLPNSPNAQLIVTIALAERDPVLAMDRLREGPAGPETQMMLGLIASMAGADPEKAATVANELAARQDAQSRALLSSVVSNWTTLDPDGAVEWALAEGTGLDPGVLGGVAERLANVDPVQAASYLPRVPAEHREVWITRMAGPYGRNDLNAALDWLEPFRGQPVHGQAIGQIVTQSMQTDPEAAAQLLATAEFDVQRSTANGVALNWARRNPAAAGAWASGLADATARAAAIRGTAMGWAANDAAAAQRWALTLPRGAERDEGLMAVIAPSAQRGRVDAPLLDAFSSDDIREQAVRRAVQILARQDPEQARTLLDDYVDDPDVRRELETQAGLPPAR